MKRCRAKGGSSRTLETPVAFSMTLRRSEPGLAVAALATDAMREPSAPTRSVRAMALVVSWWRRPTSCSAWRVAAARSIRRGKSMAHSLWPGMYGQLT